MAKVKGRHDDVVDSARNHWGDWDRVSDRIPEEARVQSVTRTVLADWPGRTPSGLADQRSIRAWRIDRSGSTDAFASIRTPFLLGRTPGGYRHGLGS